MPPQARDTGREAVYAAENQVARLLDRAAQFPIVLIAGSRITLPPERHFADLASIRRYVSDVLSMPAVRERWPAAARPVTVRERRGAAKAHYDFATSTIAVPIRGQKARWALRELVLLHEIAHHLSPAGEQSGTGSSSGNVADPAHGLAFTQRMSDLVEIVMGAEVAFLLRVALADQAAGGRRTGG
jgi:putative metallohydrolase (TIGR04338 family)